MCAGEMGLPGAACEVVVGMPLRVLSSSGVGGNLSEAHHISSPPMPADPPSMPSPSQGWGDRPESMRVTLHA